MTTNSRIVHSVKNSILVLIEQLIINILSFVCRTIFIKVLGSSYLGYNGLFSDILSLLSLAELGFGTAIVFSMFKPAAENDIEKLKSLLKIYKKIYLILGVSLTIIGLTLIPFLDFFVSGIENTSDLWIIYILYLFNTTGSYFFIYKKSILTVYQRNDIVSIIAIICSIIKSTLQILFLCIFKNFYIYLIIQLASTLLNNVFISLYVDKKYPAFKDKNVRKLDDDTSNNIKNNIKSMFWSKISSAVVTSTDNLLISKFVSTIVLGIYSNYTMFTSMIRVVVTKIFESITGSVGNLVVTSDTAKTREVFEKIWFFNFWLVGFCCSCLFVLINPFISIWIGNEYALSLPIVILICLNLYMRLIRNTLIIYTDTYGLFKDFKIKCIVEAIINLIVSLILVWPLKMGIVGVLIGTLVSNVLTNFWYEPLIIYKRTMHGSYLKYMIKYIIYFLATLAACFVAYYLGNIIFSSCDDWFEFFMYAFITVIFINIIFLLFFFYSKEFKYYAKMVKTKFFKSFSSKKNTCLCFFELLAACLIVFIHVPFPGYFGEIVIAFSRFGVPLFFAISGFYLLKNNDTKLELRNRIKRKIKRLSILLIFSFLLYFALNLLINKNNIIDWIATRFSIDNVMKLLLFGKPIIFTPNWFLISLLISYLVIYLFADVFIHNKNISKIILIFGIIFMIIKFIFVLNNVEILGVNLASDYVYRNWYVCGLPLICLGMLVRRNDNLFYFNTKTYILFILTVIFAMICENLIIQHIINYDLEIYLFNILLVVLILDFTRSHSSFFLKFKLLKLEGNWITFIYIMHMSVYYILLFVINKIAIEKKQFFDYLHPLIVLIITIISSIIINYILLYVIKRFSKSNKKIRYN